MVDVVPDLVRGVLGFTTVFTAPVVTEPDLFTNGIPRQATVVVTNDSANAELVLLDKGSFDGLCLLQI